MIFNSNTLGDVNFTENVPTRYVGTVKLKRILLESKLLSVMLYP